jgi:pyruvyl transferase EpsO
MYKQRLIDNLTQLKKMHSKIAELIKNDSVSYIDIPLHYNIGDQLIYLGTEQFIKENNINIIHRAFHSNICKRKIKKSDTILFHGGGNIGDLYPTHQKLREDIISKYKNKKIVLLPQSIYFKNKKNENSCREIFINHPNLHIYVRDKKSFEIAKSFSKNVMLMPDMAHSLHPLIDIKEICNYGDSRKILNLRRRDNENTEINALISKKTFDWDDIISPRELLTLKLFSLLQRTPIVKYKLNTYWKKNSSYLFFKSVQFFNNFDEVHTDRLHGFILSLLLGKNIVIHDNIYGKNSTYFDAWIEPNELFRKETSSY